VFKSVSKTLIFFIHSVYFLNNYINSTKSEMQNYRQYNFDIRITVSVFVRLW